MKTLVLLLLLSAAAFGQSWSGQSTSTARVVPPYKFCFGSDNGQDACIIQDAANVAKISGTFDLALRSYTVATLPPAALNAGRIYRVTDASSAGSCTSGGGSNSSLCMSDGTQWLGSAGGGGSGTVNAGTTGQVAYYAANGTTLSGTSALPNGTTATTQALADNTGQLATTLYMGLNLASPPIIGATLPNEGIFDQVVTPDGSHNGFFVGATCTVGNCGGQNLIFSSRAGGVGRTSFLVVPDNSGSLRFTPATAAGAFWVNANLQFQNMIWSNSAVTISSGFGTSPSIASSNGTATFRVNVGTGGTASTGVISMPGATVGWNCVSQDLTTPAANLTRVSGTSINTVTLTNYNTSGVATAWPASDVVMLICNAY